MVSSQQNPAVRPGASKYTLFRRAGMAVAAGLFLSGGCGAGNDHPGEVPVKISQKDIDAYFLMTLLYSSRDGDDFLPRGFLDSAVDTSQPVPGLQPWWNSPYLREAAGIPFSRGRAAAIRRSPPDDIANMMDSPVFRWHGLAFSGEERTAADQSSGLAVPRAAPGRTSSPLSFAGRLALMGVAGLTALAAAAFTTRQVMLARLRHRQGR